MAYENASTSVMLRCASTDCDDDNPIQVEIEGSPTEAVNLLTIGIATFIKEIVTKLAAEDGNTDKETTKHDMDTLLGLIANNTHIALNKMIN